MIDETRELACLPFDLEKPGKALRPVSHRAEKASQWSRSNALPLALFCVGLIFA